MLIDFVLIEFNGLKPHSQLALDVWNVPHMCSRMTALSFFILHDVTDDISKNLNRSSIHFLRNQKFEVIILFTDLWDDTVFTVWYNSWQSSYQFVQNLLAKFKTWILFMTQWSEACHFINSSSRNLLSKWLIKRSSNLRIAASSVKEVVNSVDCDVDKAAILRFVDYDDDYDESISQHSGFSTGFIATYLFSLSPASARPYSDSESQKALVYKSRLNNKHNCVPFICKHHNLHFLAISDDWMYIALDCGILFCKCNI